MKRLIAALQFLTIIPLGKSAIYDPKGMIPFFPIAGLFIGGLLSIFDHVALNFWPAPVTAVLDVVFLVVITAALHLDGLGDTADGVFGHRSREKALAIMKDSRIGVMGLSAIICTLAVKWGGIMHLNDHRTLLLVLIPAFARSGMIFGIHALEYGRPEGGSGYDLFDEPLKLSGFQWVLIPAMLSIFLGWKGIWLNLIFAIFTTTIIFYYKKRMACITGDMLGAMTEVTEALLFLFASISFY
ncbi:MAG: adenosylcobinamide-GDP ribazoletransferase [Deltaproteobacteria bacterium]|jgi:adenosylcobinamide-GDP ribazoletransferase|nr:adenosylcobinamide-GDP ribazoletransferase [Deltaproteobacteria bacterium]